MGQLHALIQDCIVPDVSEARLGRVFLPGESAANRTSEIDSSGNCELLGSRLILPTQGLFQKIVGTLFVVPSLIV